MDQSNSLKTVNKIHLELIKNKTVVSTDNLLPILCKVVSLTQKHLKAPGYQKKNFVMTVLRNIISISSDIDDLEKEQILDKLSLWSETVIDLVVHLGRNSKLLKPFKSMGCCHKAGK